MDLEERPPRTRPLEGTPSLCRPAPGLSCFRCCPPIRPPGHDHLDQRTRLTAELELNTARLARGILGGRIDGRACWGLGFVDEARRQVGCLLHPALGGLDLRRLTGYQAKCAREVCPQGKTFVNLADEVRRSLLALVQGQDSFQFSSPRLNPLWALLEWGGPVLTPLHPFLRPGEPIQAYLASHPRPRARAYLLAGLLARLEGGPGRGEVLGEGFGLLLEKEAEGIKARVRPVILPPLAGQPFVHRLGLDPLLADYIRLELGIGKLTREGVARIQAGLEAALDRLALGFGLASKPG